MSCMPAALFLMLTWTTYERLPMIRSAERALLSRFIPTVCDRYQMSVIALGYVADHLHLVLRAPPVMDIPRLVQHLKGASARIINRTLDGPGLRWAPGYTVQSISPDRLKNSIAYVRNQHLRHPDRAIPL